MAVLYIYAKETKMAPLHTTINGVIYRTVNTINGMWYIGKDEKNNPNYIGSGVYLSRAIAKYGKNNFVKEIIDRAETSIDLALLEAVYIEKYNATTDNMSYNIALGGCGGNTLSGLDSEDKLQFANKMSESWSGLTIELKNERLSPMHLSVKGKPKSQSHKDKISSSKTGIKQSAETIKKKSIISKQLYDAGIITMPKYNWTGKTHTMESKLKISESKTGVKNLKKRLFSADDQLTMKHLHKEGVKTGEIAKMFSTSGPTILRYVREAI